LTFPSSPPPPPPPTIFAFFFAPLLRSSPSLVMSPLEDLDEFRVFFWPPLVDFLFVLRKGHFLPIPPRFRCLSPQQELIDFSVGGSAPLISSWKVESALPLSLSALSLPSFCPPVGELRFQICLRSRVPANFWSCSLAIVSSHSPPLCSYSSAPPSP